MFIRRGLYAAGLTAVVGMLLIRLSLDRSARELREGTRPLPQGDFWVDHEWRDGVIVPRAAPRAQPPHPLSP